MPRSCAHASSVGDLVLVDAFERDGVDLHAQTGGKRRIDAGQHLVELAPARDSAELVRIERVERDIDALDAAGLELGRIFRQLRAVGGEGELLERAGGQVAGQRGDQRHDAAANQWLAAGQAQLGHALGNECAAQAIEFLKAQHIGLGQECHVLRHAIDAAEIAAVGHRHAQIADGALKRIDQRLRAARRAIEFKHGCSVGRCHNPSRGRRILNSPLSSYRHSGGLWPRRPSGEAARKGSA